MTELKDAATALLNEFMRWGGPLTKDQRKLLPKPRPGMDKIAGTVLDQAKSEQLDSPSAPVAEVQGALNANRDFQPIEVVLQQILTVAKDLALRWEAQAWRGVTMYYSVLSRVATVNPTLATALEPARTFFARRSPTVVQKRTTTRAARKATKTQTVANHAATSAAITQLRASMAATAATATATAPTATAPTGVPASVPPLTSPPASGSSAPSAAPAATSPAPTSNTTPPNPPRSS